MPQSSEGSQRPPGEQPSVPGNLPHLLQLQLQQLQVQRFQGPFPPPELLEHYEKVFSGAAKRIFDLAESQATHRQELERYGLRTDHHRSVMGIAAGAIVSVVVAAAGVIIALGGHQPWVGGGVITIDVVALAGVFVYGSQVRSKERSERSQRMAQLIGSNGPDTNQEGR